MTISHTLSSAWQNLKRLSRENPVFASFLFLICSIPLPLFFSSIALGIFGATCLAAVVKTKRVFWNVTWFLPLLLFGLMALSLLWSIDVKISTKALSKEMMLGVVPIGFVLFGGFADSIKQHLLKYYSYFMAGFALFSLIRAGVRYLQTSNSSVFFYHELVTEKVNAIHVSVYFALAILWFLTQGLKNSYQRIASGLLLICLFLLSSKNVILVFGILALSFAIYKFRNQKKTLMGILVGMFLLGIAGSGFLLQRWSAEIQTVAQDHTVNTEFTQGTVYSKSVKEAWTNPDFSENDYFPGTALRVLQARFFKEMLQEDDLFWTGYGLNASYGKIGEKVKQYHLHEGYSKFNFHNQYIQNFADLGIFGLVLLILMLAVSLKSGIKRKDFVHISFTFLMISLFLTESFLWRQRGVTFFVAFYCLLNSTAVIPSFRRNK